MNTIEQRLLALEKSNRRYKLLLGFMLIFAVTVAIAAFTGKGQAPDVIQAKTFEVVNDQNRVLARLTALDGSGHITTFNPQGEKQTDILPNNVGGGAVIVYDGKGSMNARITYTEGGGGSLGVYNKNGKQVIKLGNNSDGSGDFYVRNSASEDRLRLTTTDSDGGSITVFNKSNLRIFHISVASNQSGVANVYNSSSNRICALGTDDSGNGGLDCWNTTGAKTVTLPNN